MGHTTIAAYRPTRIHPQRQILPESGTPSSRPSWLLLIIVTAAVAGLTWGIMQQRIPEIDPGQVIANNLSAAKLAMESDRYLDPPEHSALHYFTAVLALDPDNRQALRGLDLLAERFVDQAKSAILEAHFAEAALAIDNVRRVQPTNRRLEYLSSELREAVDAHVTALQSLALAPNTEVARPPHRALSLDKGIPRNPEKASAGSKSSSAKSISAAGGTTEPSEISTAAEASERMPVPESRMMSSERSTSSDYAGVEHAFETAAQQIALHSRSLMRDAPAAIPTSAQPLPASGSAPALPTPGALKALKLVEPHYPQAAQVRGIEGWVDLTLTVSPAGDVIAARVEEREGSRSFERAALIAVRQWKYEPYELADIASPPQEISVRVGFRLE